MNLCFVVFMIFGLFAVGFQGESFGQGPPPLEDGESGVYVGGDFQEEVEEIISIIVDEIKSFFKWICFWCD